MWPFESKESKEKRRIKFESDHAGDPGYDWNDGFPKKLSPFMTREEMRSIIHEEIEKHLREYYDKRI
jgi:hypothetical protein